MDIQVVLIFILSILTINLVVVGVYVVLVLRDFRELLKRGHSVIDGLDSFTNAVANPFSMFSGVLGAVLDGYKAIKESKSVNSIRD